jgi:hypothetical protein
MNILLMFLFLVTTITSEPITTNDNNDIGKRRTK